jgi:collagen type XII alpha
MIDVAIIVDASESVYDVPGSIDLLLNFVKDIIMDSAVDSGNVRFAVSLYNHAVYNYFYLNTHTTAAQMILDIDTTPLPISGGTDTGLALEHLHSQVFLALMGDRSAAPNLAIVITDGKSSDNIATVTHASILKQQGVHIIAIGIGSTTDITELHQIASDPTYENVFNVNDFHGLLTIEALIEQKFIEDCTGKSFHTILQLFKKRYHNFLSPVKHSDIE